MIFIIPLIAFWFAKITGIPQYLRLTNRKPFNCPKCMGFWLGFIWQCHEGLSTDTYWILPLISLQAYLIEVIAERFKLPLN